MTERLYTEHPRLYDAIQSHWNYERDVDFVVAAADRADLDPARLLEIGCGTGEHTRRFVDRGFDVTAVDKYDGMLEVARTKCAAKFRQQTLPHLELDTEYPLAVAIRGVINHLAPEDLAPAVAAVRAHLIDGGLLIFDNSPLPPDGNEPGIDIGPADGGDYARIAQHVSMDNGRLDWRAVTFSPDGEFFINSRLMTPFNDTRIRRVLEDQGFTVETHAGFGPDDERTVFVAAA